MSGESAVKYQGDTNRFRQFTPSAERYQRDLRLPTRNQNSEIHQVGTNSGMQHPVYHPRQNPSENIDRISINSQAIRDPMNPRSRNQSLNQSHQIHSPSKIRQETYPRNNDQTGSFQAAQKYSGNQIDTFSNQGSRFPMAQHPNTPRIFARNPLQDTDQHSKKFSHPDQKGRYENTKIFSQTDRNGKKEITTDTSSRNDDRVNKNGYQQRPENSWKGSRSQDFKVPKISPEQNSKSTIADTSSSQITYVDDLDEVVETKSSYKKRESKWAMKNSKDKDRVKRQLEIQRKSAASLDEKGFASTLSSAKKKMIDVNLSSGISVANLSHLIGVSFSSLAKRMKRMGFENTNADFVLNSEISSMVVLEYGMNPVVFIHDETDLVARIPLEAGEGEYRPPVVTILGHVDHGKTTLLDTLRKSSVVSGESGGITQHIGAFSVNLPSGQTITFLDTPGHAAFSAMRERGANCTDIIVLVVAIDDGVMPQTIESIKHAKKAGVPVIVAINKCDKNLVGIDKRNIMEQLLRYDLIVEEMGGDVPAVLVSGLTGKGLDTLEETIIALAEINEYRGDIQGPCEATVIESKLCREKGNVATILVTRGVLRTGDIIVSGTSWCKVKQLLNEHGEALDSVPPSHPAQILGWKNLPRAGELVIQTESESIAKKVVLNRARKDSEEKVFKDIEILNSKRKQQKEETPTKILKTELNEKLEVNIILKTDVHGSLDAIQGVIQGLPRHEVQVNIVDSGVGRLGEADVDMAVASTSQLITFNLKTDKSIETYAKTKGVAIEGYQIIYNLVDAIKEKMSALLPPIVTITVEGEAEIQKIFHIKNKGKSDSVIAGCKVNNGKIMRASAVRVVRAGETVFTGNLCFTQVKSVHLSTSKRIFLKPPKGWNAE